MSRTNRTHLTDTNHREARKGRVNRDAAWASQDTYRRNFKGGMVMSPAVCGLWDDERSRNAAARKAERRAAKRSERQRAEREMARATTPDTAVDSVWTARAAQDAAEIKAEVDALHEDALMVNALVDEYARTGRCTVVIGKRWADVFDPLYMLVSDLIPACEILCEYDVYRREGLMG